MTLAEFIAAPFTVAALALSGALGSQLITARANLKTKRLELSYARKADAYREFLVEAAHFAHDSIGEEKYRLYLKALMQVNLVASPQVYIALGPSGLDMVVQAIRATGVSEHQKRLDLVQNHFYDNMRLVQEAMRRDLDHLGGL